MDMQAVMEKVQKLLARADEARNDNPHEREIAMRHAHALMAKHQIEMADIPEEYQASSEADQGPLGKRKTDAGGRHIWLAGVYSEIGRLYGCYVVRLGGTPTVLIHGRQWASAITRDVAAYCVASIRREARSRRDVRGASGHTAFGVGAWEGIQDQVDRILADRARGVIDGESIGQDKAMMLVDRHKQAMEEAKGIVSGKTRKVRAAISDQDAHGAGRSYGRSMSLGNQLGGGPRATRRLT